jgi:hypothetical protein
VVFCFSWNLANQFYVIVMLQKMENMVKNKELVDSPVKKEGVLFEDKLTKTVREKRGLKLDFEKPNRNVQQKLQPKATVPKVETAGNSKLQLGVQRDDFKSCHIAYVFDPLRLLTISSSTFISSIWFVAFANCHT